MGLEGLYASFSPSFEPLTHRPFTDSQCYGYILLLPALLFQLPGSHTSFFSPIGFSWSSHTSYFIILYFLLPRSVMCWWNRGVDSHWNMLDFPLHSPRETE